jgi:hypothetical protein
MLLVLAAKCRKINGKLREGVKGSGSWYEAVGKGFGKVVVRKCKLAVANNYLNCYFINCH